MFLLFFIVWVIFNGCITTEVVVFGLVISAAMFLFICKFMDYSVKKEKLLIRLIPSLLAYFFVLIWEIVKANIVTAGYILNQKIEVEPHIVKFTTDLQTELLKVILANSITLTPGTITVDVVGNEYTVHCLDLELAAGIEESVFVKRLEKMEALILK